eukprot:293780_1
MLSFLQKFPCSQYVKKNIGKICGVTVIALVSALIYYRYKKSKDWIKLTKEEINSLFNISSRKTNFPLEISQHFKTNYSIKNYYIEYNGYRSNHLAHGIIALHRLNADNETILSFMKYYSNKLEIPTNDLLQQQLSNWHSIDTYLGQRSNYYGIFNMFENDLDIVYNNDIKHLVQTRFPLLSSGISGAAFHGIIHLGYGMSINNTQIILEGIAYLTHSYLPFKYIQNNINIIGICDSIFDLLKLIKQEDTLRTCVMNNYQNKQITDRIPGAFQRGMITLSIYAQDIISKYTQLIMDKIPKIKSKNDFIVVKKWLLSTMIMLYVFDNRVEYNDFFLIHVVTSCWSLVEIIKYLEYDDANKAVVNFINAVIAAYVVQGAPDIKIVNKKAFKSDDRIKQEIAKIVYNLMNEARNGDFKDEHVYKLIQVVLECLEENIIDESCAYYAICKSLNPLGFVSITSS